MASVDQPWPGLTGVSAWVGKARLNIATTLVNAHRANASLPYLEENVETQSSLEYVFRSQLHMVTALRRMNEIEKAYAILKEVLPKIKADLGIGHPIYEMAESLAAGQ